MKDFRLKHPKNAIIAYLNINSVRKKFETFSYMMKNYVDVFVMVETKLDSSFPMQQFLLDGFKQPYRLDVTSNSGGLLVYVNDQIPSKEIKSVSIPSDIQEISIELNLRRCKWLMLPIYKPPSQNEVYFIDQLEKTSESLSNSIKNCLILGDLIWK